MPGLAVIEDDLSMAGRMRWRVTIQRSCPDLSPGLSPVDIAVDDALVYAL